MTEKRTRINLSGRLASSPVIDHLSRITVGDSNRAVTGRIASSPHAAGDPALTWTAQLPVLQGQGWVSCTKLLGQTTKLLRQTVLCAIALGFSSTQPAQAQQPGSALPNGNLNAPSALQLPALPTQQPITPNGSVVEDVIARVNDQIVTRSEYQRAEQQLLQEAQQQGASEGDLQERRANLLRDMIDQQLLLSKGKELGITGDTETMHELDDIRKKNNLPDMEALEKAAQQQGVSFEDFKQKIRDSAITQQVVRDEVGRRLNLTHAQEDTYYTAHSKDFEVPEQVHLSEILLPTAESATDAELAAAQTKADSIAAKLKTGGNFAELAKTTSGGPTASAGGDLGDFKRGTLGTVLEDATFPLPVGGVTAPIRTKQGFVILKVDSHQAAGVPPLSAVEPQVEEAIYLEQLQPALRAYLTKAREQAYLETAAGFVDTGSPRRSTRSSDVAYTAYTPPPIKKKILNRQHAEQERAARAQAQLATAREKLAEKEAAKAAAHPGANVQNVSHPVKPKKIHREKIRYGEAPRKSLPAAPVETAALSTAGTVTGQAPGVAMSPNESTTTISTGTGPDAEAEEQVPVTKSGVKTRYTSRESDAEEVRAQHKLTKAEVKSTDRPLPTTPTQTATEQHEAAPLGLNGDTTKKVKKPKHQKGEAKERLKEQPKPAAVQTPLDQTVNPALAGSPTAPAATSPASTADAPPSSTPPPL